MNSTPSNGYELHFFSKDACRFCRYAKPIYEKEIRPVFQMNGIPCYEYDTATPSGQLKRMEFNVRTVPTLILIDSKRREIFRGDSTTIRNSLKVLSELTLDDSF